MAMALVPLSIDDGLASNRGCDIACMATPWLISIGFTVAFSALFSKLWRINKLFNNRQCRRIKVQEKDVLLPFAVVFTLNFAVLLSWTLVDPLRWTRRTMNDEKWNTYGSCRGTATASKIFVGMTALVNVSALAITCWQAYKARNIGDEFSESKNLGRALFSWVQLLVVGVPVLFLIDQDNVSAKFFLQIALLFAMCMSMFLFIFVPMFSQLRSFQLSSIGKSMRNVFMKTSGPTTRPMRGSGSAPIGRGSIVVSGLNDCSAFAVDGQWERAVMEIEPKRLGVEEETTEFGSRPALARERMDDIGSGAADMDVESKVHTEESNTIVVAAGNQEEGNPFSSTSGEETSVCSSKSIEDGKLNPTH